MHQPPSKPPSLARRGALTTALVFGSALTFASCSDDPEPDADAIATAPCTEPAFAGSPLGVRCGQLVDAQGRIVFLRGVNARIEGVFDVTFDDGRTALEDIPPFTAEDAAQMRTFGFDALRLPINWSGVEPTEGGGFDEAYLDRVARAVDDARTAGVLVLIDFHQDAYSKEIGEDGAPLWAIVPPPAQLLEGPLTDLDDRRQSEQVLAAFDTFFGPGADGERLRERFAAMTGHVAARFAQDDAVMGFEIYNEPLADSAGLARVHEAALQAIRAAAPDKLVLFEPSAVRNFLDKAPISEAALGDGTAYAPHVYTLAFTATDEQRQAMTKEGLRRSHENAAEEARSWHAPLVVTEWGYDPNGIRAEDYLVWQSELFEEVQASSFFWLWKEESQGRWGCFDYDDTTGAWTERQELKGLLARVRPAAVAGWPQSIAFDRASGVFEMRFVSDPEIAAPHLIAIALALGAPTETTCDGRSVEGQVDAFGVMQVSCGQADSGEHTLRVTVAAQP